MANLLKEKVKESLDTRNREMNKIVCDETNWKNKLNEKSQKENDE